MSTMRTIRAPEALLLGSPLPPNDDHAIGVHLPEWRDTVGWAARESRVVDAMQTGYPRFFVPRAVDRLAEKIVELFHRQKDTSSRNSSTNGDSSTKRDSSDHFAVLFPSWRYTIFCLNFLHEQAPAGADLNDVRALPLVWDEYPFEMNYTEARTYDFQDDPVIPTCRRSISAVIYPSSLHSLARAFWQHTGFGISSRRAAYWLRNAPVLEPGNSQMRNGPRTGTAKSNPYFEARLATVMYTIRSVIASGQSSRELFIPKKNVRLYATGMAAITEAALAIKLVQCGDKRRCVAAVFGFTYVDTYKTITRVLGFDATLYKFSELDQLEQRLDQGWNLDFLITEFPGNPLLQFPDLARLHYLSRKHDFVFVIDDTVGTHINVEVISSCDLVCTSLTKMFSGECNVMGGSVVVSPESPYEEHLLYALKRFHDESVWFSEDVFIMEQNSRQFRARVYAANKNAELVVALLQGHPSVAEVYYPRTNPDRTAYNQVRRLWGGYGFLLSIRFTSPARAIAFYDALQVAKGPSLGTNFTLCCPYTLLAHYNELEWAAEYGVVEHLVRLSVGVEERQWLIPRVQKALQAAGEVED